MNETKIDIDFDNNMNGILLITCGNCKSKKKKPLKTLRKGTDIKCSCGATFEISDNGFKEIQQSFDDLTKTLNNIELDFNI